MTRRTQRLDVDVGSERDHRNAAPDEIPNALIHPGFAQLEHGQIERVFAHHGAARRPENRLNLPPEKQIAALDEDALHDVTP